MVGEVPLNHCGGYEWVTEDRIDGLEQLQTKYGHDVRVK